MAPEVSIAEIKDSKKRIAHIIERTPLKYSHELSSLCDCNVYLKLENFQKTGAFKLRGAANRVAQLTPEQQEKGVVAASSGNHALGVALASKLQGIRATVVMPKTAPKAKVEKAKHFGAEVIQYGDYYDEACEYASVMCQEHGNVFLPSFDDEAVICGQGTIALEVMEERSDWDAIIAPIGGGGLLSGIGTAFRAESPATKIIGVETVGMPAMKESLEAGCIQTVGGVRSLADGIMVRTPGKKTYPILKEIIDEIELVSETDIKDALYFLYGKEKLVVEGAGAVAVAALLKDPNKYKSKNIVLVVTGGNIDDAQFVEVLQEKTQDEGIIL